MPTFQVRTVSGQVWPAVPRAEAAQYWSAFQTLDRTQWLPPGQIVEMQLSQARQLLVHCREHVPFYQNVLAEKRIRPEEIRSLDDFRRIPLLSRKVYQSCYAEFHASALPPGTQPGAELSTSGSSGVPVKVKQTNLVHLWWVALALRDLAWCGIDPTLRLAVIRYLFARGERGEKYRAGVDNTLWHQSLHQVVRTGPSHLMDVHSDPHRQLDWLLQHNPDYLLSYPSNLEYLAGLLAERKARLPALKCIQAISETLHDETRQRIEERFGVPVKDTYSCSEAGYLASPCPRGHGFHVHSESVLLELLDDEGQPCRPGQEGRVVLTTLHNFLTPLIRYDIMDRAVLGDSPCPCGRGLPLLTKLVGKERPLFHLAGGRRKNSNRLALAIRKIGGFHQFRLIQRAVDRLGVHLVPDQTWTDEHRQNLQARAEEFFEGPVQVELEFLPRLELTASGKSVDVICELT